MYMRRITFITMLTALLAALSLPGCRQDDWSEKTETLPDGLYLHLTTSDGEHELLSSRAGESSSELRESEVSTLDVFIVDNADGKVVQYKHIESSAITEGKAEVMSGDWKSVLTKNSYDFYVLANYPGETTLKDLTSKDQVTKIIAKDKTILRVEGETYGASDPPSTTYKGKLFSMAGTVTTFNPSQYEDQATVSVNLARNAAKIVINLSYSSGFTSGVSRLADLTKTLVNYAVTANVFSTDIPKDAELGGEPALSGNSDQSLSNKVEGDGTSRKETLYFYTYPTDWSTDLMREAYVLLNIPYYKSGSADKINNYYKIPLRISTTSSELKLAGNTEYTYTVTVDRVGNTEIDAPVTLDVQNVTQAPWKEKKVDFGNEKPTYLITSADRIDITESMISKDPDQYGRASFTFTSGSSVDNIELSKAYYVNKDQTQVQTLNDRNLKDNCTFQVTYDDNETKRSGTVSVQITGGVPANLASHHYEFLLTNENGLQKTVRVSMRPEIYVTPLQGIMSTRTNLTTQFNVVATVSPIQISMNGQQDGNYETSQYIFYPRIARWDSGDPRKFYKIRWVKMSTGYPPSYILAADNTVSGAISQGNTNMFVIVMSQIPKSISQYPDMVQYGVGRYTPSESGNPSTDNNLISPMFIIASELGTTSGYSSFNGAFWQAKEYVEVAATSFITGYGAKPTNYRELKGWRLPTKGELALIAKLQIFPKQDVIDQTLVFKEESGSKPYYTCFKDNNFYVSKTGSVESTQTGLGSVRCVRDVSREELDDWIQAGLIK